MIAIQPGTYLSDIPDTGGRLQALCRCPGCWSEWYIDQESKPEVCLHRPVALECLNCGRYASYRPAQRIAGPAPTVKKGSAKVHKRASDDDTPLFGRDVH